MSERELIERYNDAWNAHDVDAIASMHAPDIVFHNYSAGERAEGADVVREHIATIFRNNPDIQFRGRRLVQRRGVRIALEQRRRDLVDALVGALGRENRRDQQFVGILEVQLGVGVGMLPFELRHDPARLRRGFHGSILATDGHG